MLQRNLPSGEESAARSYVEMLRARDFAGIEGDMAEGMQSETGIADSLEHMASEFPQQQPTSVKLVAAQSSHDAADGVITASTTLEYEYPDRWVEVQVDRRTENGGTTIAAMHAWSSEESMGEHNRFTFADKGMAQFAMLMWGTLCACLSVCAFVSCLQTKMRRFKWFWLVFTLVGFGKFQLDWTTGQSAFQLIYAQIPPLTVGASPYGPWIFSVALPLGAILFLINRDSLMAPRAARGAPVDEQADAPSSLEGSPLV